MIAFVVLAATWSCPAPGRGLPAQEGIQNFGRVSETLYRGAQPDPKGVRNLQRLGVGLIINLRKPGEGWKLEEAEARACGITFTNVPMRGVGRPTDEQVKNILALIKSSPKPVFIHCEHGCDRTGTIIACYRIQHDQWTSVTALEEAKRYGMSKLEHAMRQYVLDFGKKTETNPAPKH